MKVCLYSHAFWPSIGGMETVTELLAEHLFEQGIDVTVVTQTPGHGPDGARYAVVRCPDGQKLRRLVAKHNLLHANGMSVRAVLAAARCGVPIVVTHQTFNAALPRRLSELHRMVRQEGVRRPAHTLACALGMRLAQRNVCISRFLQQRLRPPRGRVIYNPISGKFRPLPSASRTSRFAFVGRLVTDKGCDVLLQALAECGRAGYRFGLDIYGDGPEKERLEAQARECGISAQVSFRGSVKGQALVEAYNRSLAVVVPSVWEEPLGIVALEAMACGRAVIASEVGGLKEVVSGTGLLFPNGNSRALSDRMIRVSLHSEFRRETENRAARFASNFSIDVIGEVYLRLYQSLLDAERTQPQRNPERVGCEAREPR